MSSGTRSKTWQVLRKRWSLCDAGCPRLDWPGADCRRAPGVCPQLAAAYTLAEASWPALIGFLGSQGRGHAPRSGEHGRQQAVLFDKEGAKVHAGAQVERLQGVVRDRRANWAQSVATLRAAKGLGARVTKTSLMLGCGERPGEVVAALEQLRDAGGVSG